MWVDSHCHLAGQDYTDPLEAILKRARDQGVEHFLTIACEVDEIRVLTAFAEEHDDVSMTVGVHPHEATQTLERFSQEQLFALLEKAAQHPKVVGLGEMGYDDYYAHSTPDDQAKVFELQLQLARKLNLPISIHTRDAEVKTLEHLKKFPEVTGVVHCFSGTALLAQGALDLGYYLSLSGIITFPKAQELRDVLKSVPLDRILLETDAPYLAPVPYRGKKNEPAFIVQTAKVLAEIKGVPLEEVARITTENFYKVFPKAHVKK